MNVCKPSGLCINEPFDAEELAAAYPTGSLSETIPRGEFCEPIDPNLLGDISQLGYSQPSWLNPQMSQYQQQSTGKHTLGSAFGQDFSNRSVTSITHYSADMWRNTPPLSNHNSPEYRYSASPSIESDMNYDVAAGPATPPEGSLSLYSMTGSFDSAADCPHGGVYIDHSSINPCHPMHCDDVGSVADPSFFGMDMAVADAYPYSSATSSPSLLPSTLSTDIGTDIRSYTPITPPYYDPRQSSGDLRRPSRSDPKSSMTENILVSQIRQKNPLYRARGSRYSTGSITSKRASPDHDRPLPVEKKRKLVSSCSKCKAPFADRSALDEHMRAEHPRPYICVFHYAGCTSRFDAKNEWKRHVATKHLGLRYWLCTEGSCAQARGPSTHQRAPSLPEFGSIFNRKDLYTQHVRRMHPDAVGQCPVDHKKAKVDSDGRLKNMQEKAMRVRCELPKYMPCPVRHCKIEFSGATAWDDRMEHVAQQHFENAAAGREPPVEFGGSNDYVLTNWAQQDDVQIVKRTARGWELCDPLKGSGGLKRSNTESFEDDAEGEDQI